MLQGSKDFSSISLGDSSRKSSGNRSRISSGFSLGFLPRIIWVPNGHASGAGVLIFQYFSTQKSLQRILRRLFFQRFLGKFFSGFFGLFSFQNSPASSPGSTFVVLVELLFAIPQFLTQFTRIHALLVWKLVSKFFREFFQ